MYSTIQSNGTLPMYDNESAEDKEFNFTRDVRHGFIRKVYGIIFTQLAITTILTAVCIHVEVIKHWMMHDGRWLVIVSGVGLLVTMIVLLCCASIARTYPANYIVLFVFTLFQAVLVASAAAHTNQVTVLKVAIGTVILTFGLTLFALQTKYDFTVFSSIMLMMSLTLLVFGILLLFLRSTWLECTYCSFGIMVFGFYLIIDTQMIVGSKQYNLNEDDYIIAAATVYIDIVNIFLYLLRLLQIFDNN